MLAARPIPNLAATERRDGAGGLRLVVPRRRPRYLVPPLSWLVRPGATRTIVLDDLGRSVWESCDGRSNVEAVVERFAAMHGLSFHEARVSATAYLSMLLERGALAIAMSPEAGR